MWNLYFAQNAVFKKEQTPRTKRVAIFWSDVWVKIAKLHLTLYDWAKLRDVFQINMLGKKFICINSVDVLKDTFLKEPNATITYADVGFASPSPLWTKRRKVTYQLLHAYGEGLTS